MVNQNVNQNYKVTFHLDKIGVYYDPNEPIHLDSLIEYAYCQENNKEMIEQEDIPELFPLPIELGEYNNVQVYKASALFIDDKSGLEAVETLHYWRKKARIKNIDVVKGSINEMQGPYRSYNTPIPVLLIPAMFGYFRGDGIEATRLLSKIKGLGKKRSYGFGKVIKIEVTKIAEDYSWIKDGQTMRYLPHASGTRLVRALPPYWHHYNRVSCLEIGDSFKEEE